MKKNIENTQMIEAAKELWVKYGGRQHLRIEREMKEAGWPFYRGMLYTRRTKRGTIVGWGEEFELRSADCGVRNEEQENHCFSTTPASGHPSYSRRGVYKRRRNAGRHSFERWLCKEFPEWEWRWKYQRYIYERLAAVTAGRCKRLMIHIPPRHGKSELVTIRYVAWRLLQDPKLNVILGSYNQRLADKFSRRVKRIVEAAEPQCCAEGLRPSGNAAPIVVDSGVHHPNCKQNGKAEPFRTSSGQSPKSQHRRLNAVSEWETMGGGVVRSAGVGAGITGFGAGLIVIDDPVKSRADAESKNNREKVDDWFKNDIYTRMEPDASIILISTRWHEDDLAGRLVKEMQDGGEEWEVVSLPALAEAKQMENGELTIDNEKNGKQIVHSPLSIVHSEDPLGRKPGQALCPQRYGVKTLERYRRKLGSYAFSALYQQRPAAAEGGQFKREWFKKIVDLPPAGLRWKRGYDLAVSTKTTADYTASFRVAFDRHGDLYIADGFRKRIEYPEQRRYIEERMRSEDATEHGVEAAMHGKAVVQELRRDASLRRYALREVKVSADKLTRALAWLNLAEAGKVVLVRGPWIGEFVDEVAAFPSGRHDDQIDAVSTAVNMLTLVKKNYGMGF